MTLDNRLHNCSFTYQKSYHLAWKRGSAFGPKMKLESLLPLIFDLAFQSHPLLRHVMYTKIVYIISSNPHFCGDLDKWWCRLYPSTNKKTTSLITVTIFGNPCPKKNIILSIPSSIIPIQVSQTPKTRKNPKNRSFLLSKHVSATGNVLKFRHGFWPTHLCNVYLYAGRRYTAGPACSVTVDQTHVVLCSV